ncbi:zf-HC2 domain-containing protein [Edaphobacter bradus]|uniref:zf-HC2 domain-containing protein n=1 Tax=Edaphobacter bradus TaxID=2259016 RepID=UPI0021DF8FE1|nr:zf-HC2 domain-containing protein [Edaphobacter bradus]
MTEHLTPSVLNLFADGELSSDQVAGVNEHLAACQACTASALSQMVLKSTAARAGSRYVIPGDLQKRLLPQASEKASEVEGTQSRGVRVTEARRAMRFGLLGWAAAVALLLVSVGIVSLQRGAVARVDEAALVTEVLDQHIGTLAANQKPQVLSSDRHTVKPWFQGKIPFTFNLPEGLPEDTRLDGANLAYLHNQPVAQLLYSIGRHRVSVFVRERGGASVPGELVTEHSGFHIVRVDTPELEFVAVSDVDPGRLRGLVAAIGKAQMKGQ